MARGRGAHLSTADLNRSVPLLSLPHATMKRLVIVLLALSALWAATATYRAYREHNARLLAQRRAAVEQREQDQRDRARAKAEAERLATLQAEKAAAEAERAAAEARRQAEAEAARRAQRDAEAARMAAGLDRLRRDRESARLEAERLAAERAQQFAVVENAQIAALAKLNQIESNKPPMDDRAAALAAAIEHQIELERRAEDALARRRAIPTRP